MNSGAICWRRPEAQRLFNALPYLPATAAAAAAAGDITVTMVAGLSALFVH